LTEKSGGNIWRMLDEFKPQFGKFPLKVPFTKRFNDYVCGGDLKSKETIEIQYLIKYN